MMNFLIVLLSVTASYFVAVLLGGLVLFTVGVACGVIVSFRYNNMTEVTDFIKKCITLSFTLFARYIHGVDMKLRKSD